MWEKGMEESLIKNSDSPEERMEISSPGHRPVEPSETPENEKNLIPEGDWACPNPSGLLYLGHLFVSSIFGGLVLSPPSVILLPFFPRLFRMWNDFVAYSWFVFVVLHFEWFLGVTVSVFSDEPVDSLSRLRTENALIICNHRTSFDWKYLWAFLLRYGRLKNEKIFLKDTLKWVPGFGWAMQFFCFLFLRRRWENDEKRIGKILSYYNSIQYPIQLLLFPEGTDLYLESVLACRRFAKIQNLPLYTQVLHPRVRGFTYSLQQSRPSLHSVYDLTIAYPDVIPQPESSIFLGQFPRHVHLLVKRYPIADLPTENESLDEWCRERFREKERVLSDYFLRNGKTFTAPLVQDPTNKWKRSLEMILCTLFWTSVEVVGIYCLIFYFWMQMYFAALTLFIVVETYLTGGFESFEVGFHFWKHPLITSPTTSTVVSTPSPSPSPTVVATIPPIKTEIEITEKSKSNSSSSFLSSPSPSSPSSSSSSSPLDSPSLSPTYVNSPPLSPTSSNTVRKMNRESPIGVEVV